MHCRRWPRSRLAGVWLDGAFQLGANVCLVGLYNAAVLTAERSLCFLVSTQFGEQIESYSQTEGHGRAGRMLRALLSTSQTGVAPLYILTNALCAAILVWMPYTLLVEFSMLLSVPSILLFMWSFVALRIQRPHVDRPFLIPGGYALLPRCSFPRFFQVCCLCLPCDRLADCVPSVFLLLAAIRCPRFPQVACCCPYYGSPRCHLDILCCHHHY